MSKFHSIRGTRRGYFINHQFECSVYQFYTYSKFFFYPQPSTSCICQVYQNTIYLSKGFLPFFFIRIDLTHIKKKHLTPCWLGPHFRLSLHCAKSRPHTDSRPMVLVWKKAEGGYKWNLRPGATNKLLLSPCLCTPSWETHSIPASTGFQGKPESNESKICPPGAGVMSILFVVLCPVC